jgi:hypothetical protein
MNPFDPKSYKWVGPTVGAVGDGVSWGASRATGALGGAAGAVTNVFVGNRGTEKVRHTYTLAQWGDKKTGGQKLAPKGKKVISHSMVKKTATHITIEWEIEKPDTFANRLAVGSGQGFTAGAAMVPGSGGASARNEVAKAQAKFDVAVEQGKVPGWATSAPGRIFLGMGPPTTEKEAWVGVAFAGLPPATKGVSVLAKGGAKAATAATVKAGATGAAKATAAAGVKAGAKTTAAAAAKSTAGGIGKEAAKVGVIIGATSIPAVRQGVGSVFAALPGANSNPAYDSYYAAHSPVIRAEAQIVAKREAQDAFRAEGFRVDDNYAYDANGNTVYDFNTMQPVKQSASANQQHEGHAVHHDGTRVSPDAGETTNRRSPPATQVEAAGTTPPKGASGKSAVGGISFNVAQKIQSTGGVWMANARQKWEAADEKFTEAVTGGDQGKAGLALGIAAIGIGALALYAVSRSSTKAPSKAAPKKK